MITPYTITDAAWTPITEAGQSRTCWLDEDDDGAGGTAEVRIWHGESAPGAGAFTEAVRVYKPIRNEDFLRISAKTALDVYYARAAPGASATLAVSDGMGVTKTWEPGVGASSAFGELQTASFDPMCGWAFPYNINPALVKTTVTNGGSVTHNESFAVLTTSTDPAGTAKINTFKTSRYNPGIGGRVRFTAVFDTPKENTTQIVGLGDEEDGWFFGYDGLQFGIMRRNSGVDTWVYKDAWNKGAFSELDPTKGNVYQIAYQWLGFGDQSFSIKTENGGYELAHVIRYSNMDTDTSIENPNLPLMAMVDNNGSTESTVLKTPSAIAGLDGDSTNDAVALTLADAISGKSIASGAGQPIISFYNPPTYQGKNNRLFVQALRVTFAAEGAKPVLFKILANAVPTDGTFTPINVALSPVESNKTFTTITGGVLIGAFSVAKTGQLEVDLTGSKFKGYPEQYITLMADTTSLSEVTASVAFRQFL